MGLRDAWNRMWGGSGDNGGPVATPLEGMQVLQGLDQRYLVIGFQPTGVAGQAVVARGNPDLAVCVAIYIPGIGSGLGSIGNHLRFVDALHEQVSSQATEAVSVIAWAGYEAPMSAQDARSSDYADRAAVALAGFVEGLRLTHQGPNRARITVIAQGYGGLVVGSAARGHDLGVDDVVFVGCATAGVDHASRLRVRGQIFTTPPGINGDGTPDGSYGPRPDSAGFGAHVLQPVPGQHADAVTPFVPALASVVAGQASA